ncbi:putative serine/threonine-protein phosphatase PP2A catalytic subunit-like isoform 1 [Capsicum annuum]|uniref:Uncharacterized protein n=1 Tax=Capsicum annuum TaxID=4072 RepID=A0A2G2YVS1_CAPAN|nr:putative serine/threonine-protein phosphatase PP2A catalytic subunit-like isoform 1 [Capsicum annuum]PHT73846.1 hypothetical protein T459_21123 [Capsicum annuum]
MAPFEALYGRRYRSPIGWYEVSETQLYGPNLVHQAMEKVKIIRERLKTAQSRQKSYADVRRRELEFEISDWVFLKVSLMKGFMRFGKKFGFRSSGIPCIHVEEMHWRSFYGISSRGYQSDRILVLRRRDSLSKADCLSHSNSNLFQLSNLKWFDLSHNDFSGSLISTKFGELSSLMHLDLMYSGFTGVIPEEISHLSKLQVLSISTVDPYGLRLGSYNFEPLLKNLIQLRKLHLDSVSICSTIPLNFSSYLATLWLPSTQLRGVLPERVFHLSNLEHLDLSFNSLTGPIPSNVSGLQNLQLLYLSSNYLNGTIPSFIFSLPSLQLLDLRNNSFSGKIQEFKFNNTLEFVSVKQNQLQGPIPKSLLDLQDLKLKTAKNWTYTLQCYYIRMHSLLLRRLENKEVYRNYGEQNIL